MSNEIVSAGIIKNATESLHESINKFNEQSSKQTERMLELTNQMIWLTRIIAFLTLIMTAGVGVQIFLALK